MILARVLIQITGSMGIIDVRSRPQDVVVFIVDDLYFVVASVLGGTCSASLGFLSPNKR